MPNKPRIGIRAWLWLCGGLALLAWSAWGQPSSHLTEIVTPIVAVDLSQARLDTAVPAPDSSFTIRQTFVPRWDGFREIELLLVRWETGQDGRFWLRLRNAQDQVVAEELLDSVGVVHNQTHLFRFPPQPHSAGQRYTLELSGDATNPLSVWSYSLDALAHGHLTLEPTPLGTAVPPPTTGRDLRLITRYQLTPGDALAALGTMLWQHGRYLLLALLFIPLPGYLLLLAWPPARRGHWDMLTWVGLALALGLALWPLLWFGFTLLGGHWAGWSLWLVTAVGWLAVLWWWRSCRPTFYPATAVPLTLTSLLLLALAGRFLAVRDINIPPWVDASRHALITAVMIAQGQTPTNYAPYLPVDRFPYHFGFHTLAASLGLMTHWPLPDLLLFLGQLLNGLAPFMVYTAVSLLTRRRGPALTAAFLVALPFFFPAYYATWGRLTQLDAMLILPLLLALTWLLVCGSRRWRAAWPLVGVLAAGLFLVHFRVFLFYIPWAALVWLRGKGRHGRYLTAATTLALLLVSPRLWQLPQNTNISGAMQATIPGYNNLPVGYFQAGWEETFLWLAGAGLLIILAATLWRRPWATLPLTLAAWVGLLFILLSGQRLGLPETTLVNINSMVITLFLPLSLFLALVADSLWRGLGLHRPTLWSALPRSGVMTMAGLGRAVLHLATGGFVLALALFGLRQQVTILNPQTILASPADRVGLDWAAANLPPAAHVAVNSWLWLGQNWAGQDGGAWLTPLTGLRSTTPPADYVYNRQLALEVQAFNEWAREVTDWQETAVIDHLRQQGVTHIFIGTRGGFFDPAKLAHNTAVTLHYSHDGVFIFALNTPPPAQ